MTKKEILENSKSVLSLKNRIERNSISEPEIEETVRENFLTDSPNRRRFIESTLAINAASKEFRNVFGIEAPYYELKDDCCLQIENDMTGEIEKVKLNDPMNKTKKATDTFLDCWELINAAEFESETREPGSEKFNNKKAADNQRFFVDRKKEEATSRFHSPICPPGFERWAGRYLYSNICKNFSLDEITMYKIFSDMNENTIPSTREIFNSSNKGRFDNEHQFDCVIDPSCDITKNKYSYTVNKEGERYLNDGILPIEYTTPEDAAPILYYKEQVPVSCEKLTTNKYKYSYDWANTLFEYTFTPLVKFMLIKEGATSPFNTGYAVLSIKPEQYEQILENQWQKSAVYIDVEYCVNILTSDNETFNAGASREKGQSFLWWNWTKTITYPYRVMFEPVGYSDRYEINPNLDEGEQPFDVADESEILYGDKQLYLKSSDNVYTPISRNDFNLYSVDFKEIEDETEEDNIRYEKYTGYPDYYVYDQWNFYGEYIVDEYSLDPQHGDYLYNGEYFEYIGYSNITYYISRAGEEEEEKPTMIESATGDYIKIDGEYIYQPIDVASENRLKSKIVEFVKKYEEDCLKYHYWMEELGVDNPIPDAEYSISLMKDIVSKNNFNDLINSLKIRYWYDIYEAKKFSKTESYSVGDYVIYENKLYECSTAHQGSWNSSHFSEQVEPTEPTSTIVPAVNIGAPTNYIYDYSKKQVKFLWITTLVPDYNSPLYLTVNKFNITFTTVISDPKAITDSYSNLGTISYTGPSNKDLTKSSSNDKRKTLQGFIDGLTAEQRQSLIDNGIIANNKFLGYTIDNVTKYDFEITNIIRTCPVYYDTGIKRASTLNDYLTSNDSLFKLAYSTISSRIDKRTGTLRETCHVLEGVETSKQMTEKLKNDLKLLSEGIAVFNVVSGYGSNQIIIQVGSWENEKDVSDVLIRLSTIYILTDRTKVIEKEDILTGKFLKASVTSVPQKVNNATYEYKEATLVYNGGDFYVKDERGEYVKVDIKEGEEPDSDTVYYTRSITAGPTYKLTLNKKLPESFRGIHPYIVKTF